MSLKDYNRANVLFLGAYHLLLIVLLPIYLLQDQQAWLWLSCLLLIALCGIGISAGYHRYYAHRTYRTNAFVESILLFLGTLNVQGSALKWASDHRLHHRFVDTDQDPYSIKKGFWYAHFIWILKEGKGVDWAVVHDLKKRNLVLFQHKHYAPLMILANAIVVILAGWLFQDYFGAFVVIFLARLFVNHHTTWFINSLAHTWGAKPYSKEHSAVNNWIISLLTYGEGYHNYHHTFSSDYRNGTRWYQFDPTKTVIWLLSKIGLAKGLKTVSKPIIAKKLVEEDEKLMRQKLNSIRYVRREVLEKSISDAARGLQDKLSAFSSMLHEKRVLKRRKAVQELRQLKARMRGLKRSIRQDFKAWFRLCDDVLRLPSMA